ncbi:MAG: DUF1365 domain-containing protein [Candidatus Eremiobacteraeota bacterium]|nr:DUF1365 domain-containing protein [Candidatus Eremiobacteraeota bacterium]
MKNHFKYPLFMMFIDLEELTELFKASPLWSAGGFNLAWFRRKDYMEPHDRTLAEAAKEAIRKQTGSACAGPVRVLTHLRYFGHIFNPVTFYYAYDEQGKEIEAIAAQITNTPWGERFTYVLDAASLGKERTEWTFTFGKNFHVSPFMPMDLTYEWTFRKPAEELFVRMHTVRNSTRFFTAALSLQRKEITGAALHRLLLTYPFMTVKVVLRIYWQALRLNIKKAPVYEHPQEKRPSR